MDQWAGGVKNRVVNIVDIGAVVARSGSSLGSTPTEAASFAQAITPPGSMSGYYASADRAGVIPGQNVWNLRPPNGVINIIDIGAVVAQSAHNCSMP
jgi:hypothetical protein